MLIFKLGSLLCWRQVAEEDCGVALANDMDAEPYFVDFMRDAPEATGKRVLIVTDCEWIIYHL